MLLRRTPARAAARVGRGLEAQVAQHHLDRRVVQRRLHHGVGALAQQQRLPTRQCLAHERQVAALDNAARVAVKRYEDGLRLGAAGGDDLSDLDLPPGPGGEPSEQARLPRKDFVEWSL